MESESVADPFFEQVTNAFSKKVENHEAAIALHHGYYNFARIHQTLRVTPGDGSGYMRSRLESAPTQGGSRLIPSEIDQFCQVADNSR